MILTVLKVDIAIAVIEMPMAIKHFGWPGDEISDFCGSAIMISLKSSSEHSMVARLTLATDFVIDFKGSSFKVTCHKLRQLRSWC